MHDAGFVCRGEAVGDLRGDLQDSAWRKGGLPDLLTEGESVDELGDDVRGVVVEGRVEDGDDIGMIEGACRARFRHKSQGAIWITPVQQLQGDLAFESRIPGAIHHTTPALPDERKDAVRPELLSHS